MAERRMFAKTIITSGKFLKMPPTARLLYYDLGMLADDDGIVEAYTVMLSTKATEDDLRILVAKGYIQILNEELVTKILDWNVNNQIRSDRYHPSIYKDLLLKFSDDNQLTTNWQPTDNQMETEVSIGKVSIVKDSIGKDKTKRFARPELDDVKDLICEKGYSFDAEEFYYYYESNGWKVGRNPMKDWKATAAQWNARRKNEKPSSGEIDWSKV